MIAGVATLLAIGGPTAYLVASVIAYELAEFRRGADD